MPGPSQPLAQVLRGFTMGTADVVPGISGGTVALVVGIYERLLANISTGAGAVGAAVTGDGRGFVDRLRQVEWVWLISLLAGIGLAVVSLAAAIEHLIDEHPVQMAGLFFGLVVGSVVIAARLIDRYDGTSAALTATFAVGFFLFVGLRTATEAPAAGGEMASAPLWAFFGAGAIAICAMILPGISGALMLVMMGMYVELLAAVNQRDLLLLGTFAVGAVIGLSLFSSVLNWFLDHHRDRVLAAMVGLMVGSLRVLWPWPGGTTSTTLALPSGPILVPVLLAVVGIGIVLGIGALSRRLDTAVTDRTEPGAEDPEAGHPG